MTRKPFDCQAEAVFRLVSYNVLSLKQWGRMEEIWKTLRPDVLGLQGTRRRAARGESYMCYMMLLAYFSPWRYKVADSLDMAVHLSIVALMAISTLFYDHTEKDIQQNDAVGVFATVMSCCPFILFPCFFIALVRLPFEQKYLPTALSAELHNTAQNRLSNGLSLSLGQSVSDRKKSILDVPLRLPHQFSSSLGTWQSSIEIGRAHV